MVKTIQVLGMQKKLLTPLRKMKSKYRWHMFWKVSWMLDNVWLRNVMFEIAWLVLFNSSV